MPVDPGKETAIQANEAIKGARAAASAKGKTLCAKAFYSENFSELANQYTQLVINSEGPFRWDEIELPEGIELTDEQKSEIKEEARLQRPDLFPRRDSEGFVEFPKDSIIAEFVLPNDLLTKSDKEQFEWLDDQLLTDKELQEQLKVLGITYNKKTRAFEPSTKRYTWHHHQDTGKMQLVEMGIHSATSHNGGREVWGGGASARKPKKS